MSKQLSRTLQLNDHKASNWSFAANPVAILNMDSTTHDQIAYCWGIAANLNALADLGISSDDAGVSNFAELISSGLAPLVAVLKQLGDSTHDARRKVAMEGNGP
jgi:hypothetical protein